MYRIRKETSCYSYLTAFVAISATIYTIIFFIVGYFKDRNYICGGVIILITLLMLISVLGLYIKYSGTKKDEGKTSKIPTQIMVKGNVKKKVGYKNQPQQLPLHLQTNKPLLYELEPRANQPQRLSLEEASQPIIQENLTTKVPSEKRRYRDHKNGWEADEKRKRVLVYIKNHIPPKRIGEGAGIYMLVNPITGDAYVGKAVRLLDRIGGHEIFLYSDPNDPIYHYYINSGNQSLKEDLHILNQHYDIYVLERPERGKITTRDQLKKWLSEREAYWYEQFGTYNIRKVNP